MYWLTFSVPFFSFVLYSSYGSICIWAWKMLCFFFSKCSIYILMSYLCYLFFIRFDMDMCMENVMFFLQQMFNLHSNVMALVYIQIRIDEDGNIDQRLVAMNTSFDIPNFFNFGDFSDARFDFLDLLFIKSIG